MKEAGLNVRGFSIFNLPFSIPTPPGWADDAAHLVLTAKVESMTLQTPEQKAVFDRQ